MFSLQMFLDSYYISKQNRKKSHKLRVSFKNIASNGIIELNRLYTRVLEIYHVHLLNSLQ